MIPTTQPPLQPSDVEPPRRGRPRKPRTLVVNVRLTLDTYDAYCRTAIAAGDDVRSVLRHVLTLHAPTRRD